MILCSLRFSIYAATALSPSHLTSYPHLVERHVQAYGVHHESHRFNLGLTSSIHTLNFAFALLWPANRHPLVYSQGKERTESEWDPLFVPLVEYFPIEGFYRRVALGKVFKSGICHVK